ncbi:MAG: glycoside hydrolase family 16 protein [Xanthomonadales bacterium]|nr:glycoside hydrolase family 16 protein [Xanthomonadales bacterium]
MPLKFPVLLLWTALLSAVATDACSESVGPSVQYPAANLEDDSYRPGADWMLVWSDEFDGEMLDPDNWNRQVVRAGRFNDEWQRYTDSTENAYVNDGALVIKVIHEGEFHGHDQYTSARLNTARKQTFRYGRIAARIQLPYGEGIWPAFWMLGANINENGGDTPWPQSGEIDILELYGSKDDGAIEANIHYAGSDGRHASLRAPVYKLESGIFADAFHVFEIEWDEQRITWRVDGEQYASTPIDADERSEFHQDFFILLNIAIGGSGRPNDSTPFPQVMYVDWVRVYQKATDPK